jgi:glycerophosphoryl diester phosphodiesterase
MATLFEAIQEKKTLIFGHRGASRYAPMNTLAAFELAAELGADGVELDVHRSADGHVVLLHDFTVDSTTDGTGRITDMTLEQIKQLDAGSWKDAKFAGERIPTLDEVFESVGQKYFINVEIKSESMRTDGVEQAVAEVIQRHNMANRVIVSSFNPMSLRRFHAILPDIAIGYLTAPDVPLWIRLSGVGMTYQAYHPYEKTITPEMVKTMAKRGIIVNTWTVNDAERAKALAEMGVSVIISDVPDVIRDAVFG